VQSDLHMVFDEGESDNEGLSSNEGSDLVRELTNESKATR